MIATIAKRLEWPEEAVSDQLKTYLNEAYVGLDVARRGPSRDRRILEVGAGLGVLSLFLRAEGYDITAVEPVGQGFDFFRVAGEEIRRACPEIDLPTLELSVTELNPDHHGRFDFIFSVHVLEHVPDADAALSAMARMLRPDGHMAHLCPNYAMPYDPHFSLPLVPFKPAATSLFLPKRINDSGAWRSLNFITYTDVKNFAERAGFKAEFQRGLLAMMFTRLETDPIFAQRHRGAAQVAYKTLKALGLIEMMARLPPRIVSPMLVEFRRA